MMDQGSRLDDCQFIHVSRAFPLEELDINATKEREPGVDMLRPYRVQIRLLAGDCAEYDLIQLDDNDDVNDS